MKTVPMRYQLIISAINILVLSGVLAITKSLIYAGAAVLVVVIVIVIVDIGSLMVRRYFLRPSHFPDQEMGAVGPDTEDTFQPDWASPPGDTIKDMMAELSFQKTVLEYSFGWTAEQVDDLLEGRKKIDAEIADKLAEIFRSPSAFWLKREEQYREGLEQKKTRDTAELSEEERHLFDAVMSARKIQEFLWGEYNDKWGLEEWKRMFRKRLHKIDDIDAANPHAMIELRKRLLQNTALGVALLRLITESPDVLTRKDCPVPSNLPEYRDTSMAPPSGARVAWDETLAEAQDREDEDAR